MSDNPENANAPVEPDEASAVSALAGIGDSDALFETLWNRVLETWDDDKPHRAILELALKSEHLPELAGRYRALQDDPDKGARAKKKIDGIIVAATQLMMATKVPIRTKTPWHWNATAVLVALIVCGWLFYTLFVPHRH